MNVDLFFRTDNNGLTVVEVSPELLALLNQAAAQNASEAAEGADALELDASNHIRVAFAGDDVKSCAGDTLCDCPEVPR